MASPTTRLDAVNTALSMAGRQPVATLVGPLPIGAAQALQLLEEANRSVQAQGWHFNTEREVSLPVDINGRIPVPANAIEVDLSRANAGLLDVEVRNGFLYDLKLHTDVFNLPEVKADVVYLFDFEEAPEAFRQYVMYQAAYTYVDRYLRDARVTQTALREAQKARADAKAYDTRQGDYSTWNSSPANLAVWRRRPGRSW